MHGQAASLSLRPGLALENIEYKAATKEVVILAWENFTFHTSVKRIRIDEKYLDIKSHEFHITKREKEVLLIVLKEFTNREICEKNLYRLVPCGRI